RWKFSERPVRRGVESVPLSVRVKFPPSSNVSKTTPAPRGGRLYARTLPFSFARFADAICCEATPFGCHPDCFGLRRAVAVGSGTADHPFTGCTARWTAPACLDNAVGRGYSWHHRRLGPQRIC